MTRLPLSANDHFLRELFSKFGVVKSVKVKHPHLKAQNPYMPVATGYCIGYVDFEKEEDASTAIEQLNGYNVNGNQISVAYYDKSQSTTVISGRGDIVGSENFKALFLKDINKRVSIFFTKLFFKVCFDCGRLNLLIVS